MIGSCKEIITPTTVLLFFPHSYKIPISRLYSTPLPAGGRSQFHYRPEPNPPLASLHSRSSFQRFQRSAGNSPATTRTSRYVPSRCVLLSHLSLQEKVTLNGDFFLVIHLCIYTLCTYIYYYGVGFKDVTTEFVCQCVCIAKS